MHIDLSVAIVATFKNKINNKLPIFLIYTFQAVKPTPAPCFPLSQAKRGFAKSYLEIEGVLFRNSAAGYFRLPGFVAKRI
jgi:hypothetical protein